MEDKLSGRNRIRELLLCVCHVNRQFSIIRRVIVGLADLTGSFRPRRPVDQPRFLFLRLVFHGNDSLMVCAVHPVNNRLKLHTCGFTHPARKFHIQFLRCFIRHRAAQNVKRAGFHCIQKSGMIRSLYLFAVVPAAQRLPCCQLQNDLFLPNQVIVIFQRPDSCHRLFIDLATVQQRGHIKTALYVHICRHHDRQVISTATAVSGFCQIVLRLHTAI